MAAIPSLPQIAPAKEPEQKSKLSYRTRRNFEMREASFGESVDEQICKWVWEQIDVRSKQLENLHKHKVPEMRRIASSRDARRRAAPRLGRVGRAAERKFP